MTGPADALAAAFDELRVRCVPMRPREHRDSRWTLPFPPADISLHVVLRGGCIVQSSAHLRRRFLEERDVLLVHAGVDGTLLSTSDAAPPDVLSATVEFDAPHGHPLLASLPPIVLATPGRLTASLGPSVHALLEELSIPLLGAEVIAARLCEVLVIGALRVHLGEDLCWNDKGWFRMLADPLLRESMRRASSLDGTVRALSRAVGRSRQRFRARFVQLAGTTPSSFLRGSRLRRAAELL